MTLFDLCATYFWAAPLVILPWTIPLWIAAGVWFLWKQYPRDEGQYEQIGMIREEPVRMIEATRVEVMEMVELEKVASNA